MDSSEVRMHSGFIGELLNPKGSHGLKEVPLKTGYIKKNQKKFIIYVKITVITLMKIKIKI